MARIKDPAISSKLERFVSEGHQRVCDLGVPAIAEYLANIARIHPLTRHHSGDGWPSADHMLLDIGLSYRAQPAPLRLCGTPKRCFANAWQVADSDRRRYVYCEGVAFPALGIPVHHAWVLDTASGHALELTWPGDWMEERGDFQYLGLPIDTDFAKNALRASGSVLYDYRRRHPILSGIATAESWIRADFVDEVLAGRIGHEKARRSSAGFR